jgi:hypothetical protein
MPAFITTFSCGHVGEIWEGEGSTCGSDSSTRAARKAGDSRVARDRIVLSLDSKSNEPSTSVLYSSTGIRVDLEPTLARSI